MLVGRAVGGARMRGRGIGAKANRIGIRNSNCSDELEPCCAIGRGPPTRWGGFIAELTSPHGAGGGPSASDICSPPADAALAADSLTSSRISGVMG